MSKTAKRLKEMGVVLPNPPRRSRITSFVRAGSLLFVSGQLPLGEDGKLAERHQGKLSPDSEVDAAREAARLCAINVLAQAAGGARRSRQGETGRAARRVLQRRIEFRHPCLRR